MDKVEHETIDGITYASTKLPASVGLALLPKLVQVLGEQFVQIIALGGMDELGARPDVIAQLVTRIAEKADECGLPDLVPRLLQKVKASRLRTVNGADGGPVLEAFDEHFSGEYLHLLRVLAFVVRHNYAGFTLGPRSTTGPSSDASSSGEGPAKGDGPA